MDILFYGSLFWAYIKTVDMLTKVFGKTKRGPYKKRIY